MVKEWSEFPEEKGGKKKTIIIGALIAVIAVGIGAYVIIKDGGQPSTVMEEVGEGGGGEIIQVIDNIPVYRGSSLGGTIEILGIDPETGIVYLPSGWFGKIYSPPAGANTIIDWYRTEMPARGWTKVEDTTSKSYRTHYDPETEESYTETITSHVLAYTKDENAAVIEFKDEPDSDFLNIYFGLEEGLSTMITALT